MGLPGDDDDSLLMVNGDYESDDDSIVYGGGGDEQCAVNHHHHSSSGRSNSVNNNNNSTNDSQPTQYSQQTTKSSSLMSVSPRIMVMTREERRKRRREWRERREQEPSLLEDEEDEMTGSSSMDEEDYGDDTGKGRLKKKQTTEDAFASLQALLQDDASTCTHPQEATPGGSTSGAGRDDFEEQSVRDKSPRAQEKDDIADPIQNVSLSQMQAYSKGTDGTGRQKGEDKASAPEPSPPDFAQIVQDEDMEEDQMRAEHATAAEKLSQTTATRKEKERAQRRKIQSQAKRVGSSPPPPRFPLVTTSQNASRANKKPRRRHSSFHANSKNITSQAAPPTQIAQDDSNIVGLRPSHWQRSCSSLKSSRIPATGFLRSAAEQTQAARLKALRAATLRPSISTNAAASQHKENLPRNPSLQEASIGRSQRGGTMTTEKLRSMSFRPQTMPKNRTDPLLSPVDKVPDEDVDPAQSLAVHPGGAVGGDASSSAAVSIHRPTFSSPTPPRRGRSSRRNHNAASAGPWTKRLAALNLNQANDAMKLQHAGMHRHGVSFDLNDPRRKATSFTDVTILAQKDCHGGSLPDSAQSWAQFSNSNTMSAHGAPSSNHPHKDHLTVLCHIHDHGPMSKGLPAGSSTISVNPGWISFTRTTARNIGLHQGLQLRLYDAVLLPLEKARTTTSFLLICTQLCERHPGTLNSPPPLAGGSGVATIAATN